MLKSFAALLASAGLVLGLVQESPDLDGMAADSNGRIYGFIKGHTKKNCFLFEDGRWREFTLEVDRPFVAPFGVLSMRDGRVAFALSLGKNQWALAILEGTRTAELIEFGWSHDAYDSFTMVEDSKGNIWFAASLPEVVVCMPSSGRFRVFDLSPYACKTSSERWNPVCFTEDSRGGAWLWTVNRNNFKRLPLPVSVVDGRLQAIDAIPELLGREIVQVLPRDATSMWLVTRVNDGVYSLDLDQLTAKAVPGPVPRTPDALLPFNQNCLWFIASGPGLAVWELADGEWWKQRKLQETVQIPFGNYPPPGCAKIASGILVPAWRGILFVPYDGSEPVLLDWHRGFPFMGADKILPLGGDRFLALDRPHWVMGELQEFLAPRPQANAVEFRDSRGWAVDREDRIFTFRRETDTVLSIFERDTWRELQMPDSLKGGRINYIAADSSGRIWFFSGDDSSCAGILMQDLATWKIFPDYRSALLAFRENFEGFTTQISNLLPIIGPGGQIAFRKDSSKIVHWDGHKWESWHESKIGLESNDHLRSAFFDEKGRLCIDTIRNKETWKLGGDGKWTAFPKETGIPAPGASKNLRPSEILLPIDFQPKHLREPKVRQDNVGMTWVVAEGQLYRYNDGKTAQVFPEGMAHPFLNTPFVTEVRVDRYGNTWFEMSSTHHILLPAKAASGAGINLTADQWGFVTVDAPPDGSVEWRIDGGPWRPLHGGPPGFLAPGHHEVQIQILSDHLDRTGLATRNLEITVSRDEQLLHLIEILKSATDPLRQAALEGLARQPSCSIPVLRHAIANANAPSWWLSAALQECERRSAP